MNKLLKKKIIVTGGAGFIGSHLCRELLQDGNNVICLDNLLTGNIANIRDLKDNIKFSFIKHDITKPINIVADFIYHLACPASPVHYQEDPIQTSKTNFLGTLCMLELAKMTKAKILFSSTSEVYGDPKDHPQRETYWGNVNPIGIRSCYDEGKRVAESLCFDYQRQHKVAIRVVRIFNTYGPSMHPHDGRVVSNFIVQALQNKNITLYGQGTQTRSFQYVDDLIVGLKKMMQHDTICGPVNLGNPEEFTISALAEKVLSLIPESKSKVVYLPLPADDPKQRRPDIRLAKKELAWVPRVSLQDGLEKTIAYFREII